MKLFMIVLLLLAGGGYFYFNGGQEKIAQFLNPGSLPETIEVENATFVGDEQNNPFAK